MKKGLRKQLYYSMLPSVFIVMVLLLVTSLNHSYAQGPVEELSGWFSIVWGDSEDGKSSTVYTLSDSTGQETMLQLDETVIKNLGGVLKFNGKLVSVQGTLSAPSGPNMQSASVQRSQAGFNVISISPVPLLEPQALAIEGVSDAAVSGTFPWVTIMCKFADIADEPNNTAYFNGMYSSTKPGMDHYWKELSFNQVDVSGSGVGGTGWYTLPNTELHYNPTDTRGGTDIGLLADECIAAADDAVDYSSYNGINMMFNSDFDNGYAWGGSGYMTLDGVFKKWSITWEPPWSYHNISVIAHEMGHGFGLPHSTAPGVGAYDNPWDVMSQDRYNCAAGWDPTYGCMAQHTISYHKDLLGWIPGSRIITVPSGTETTITLEDLASPASSNYQMVKILIGETSNFYTVEARKFTGYDVKLPDEVIVIHNVDTTRDEPAVLDPDGSSTNLWSVGETFIDAANDITVTMNADTGTGFEVTINNAGTGTNDTDNDGIPDSSDNCPVTANPVQADADGDGAGDICDGCPNDPTNDGSDGDGICDDLDNCVGTSNPGQEDGDNDGIGDVCELPNGDWAYCDNSPCKEGEGDCDGDSQCDSGLSCVEDVGANYGWDPTVDVCELPGELLNGDWAYCDNSPCKEGEGDCDGDSQCDSGLSCVEDVGANYGWDSTVDVCEKVSCGGGG
jgi:M6 family metalloprotease-like protein